MLLAKRPLDDSQSEGSKAVLGSEATEQGVTFKGLYSSLADLRPSRVESFWQLVCFEPRL